MNNVSMHSFQAKMSNVPKQSRRSNYLAITFVSGYNKDLSYSEARSLSFFVCNAGICICFVELFKVNICPCSGCGEMFSTKLTRSVFTSAYFVITNACTFILNALINVESTLTPDYLG